MIDPVWTTQALAWTVAWGGVGVVARDLLARHAMRQQSRRRDGKAVR